MKIWKKIFILFVGVLFCIPALAEVDPEIAALEAKGVPIPRDIMEETLEEIVSTVEKLPGDENLTERREKLREVISAKFNFTEMAKRSLGSHWLKISETEQTEFTDTFSELLATTYLSRVDEIERGMVKIDSQRIKHPRAIIKTTVYHQKQTFPIDYRLVHQEDGWKVYDVVIENIGLIANYRTEFGSILRKEKFTGLMSRLKKKIQKGDTAPA